MNLNPVSQEQRLAILNQAIVSYIAQGYNVAYKEELACTAVLRRKKPLNNTLHIILSLVTCGLWLTIWLILFLTNKETSINISVDQNGNVKEYAN